MEGGAGGGGGAGEGGGPGKDGMGDENYTSSALSPTE